MVGRVGAVFYVSIALTAVFVLWGAVWPEHLAGVSKDALAFLIAKLGWFYLLSVTAFLGFSLYAAFGPFGKIKLGRPADEPEYSTLTWFAMLFTAGMAIGLVFWGVAEPITHFAKPPIGGGAPRSAEAAATAMRTSFFHWGLHPWATYTIVGLAVAFFQYRKGESGLISVTFRPVLGRRVDGPVGKGIDVFAVLATAFGVAASFGLGAMQINEGLNFLNVLPNTTGTQLLIIAVVMVLYTASALSGLDRGIKYLSHCDMILSYGLLLFVLLAGPTAFIFETLTTSVGDYLGNLIPLSLRLAPFHQDKPPGNMTVFYWAWWIAWAPAVGIFIARISKGRTVREFVLGVLLAPTLLSVIWFAIFGGSALWLDIVGQKGIVEEVQKNVTSAFFVTLGHFPLGGVLCVVATLLIVIAFVTSADSTTYVLGMFSSGGDRTPKLRVRLAWGVLQAAIAAVLLLAGGKLALRAAETACLVAALPFMVVMLLMMVSLHKALKADVQLERRLQEARTTAPALDDRP